MRSFESLGYLGQARRLRKLAVEALVSHGLAGARVTLLSHRGNSMFGVDDVSGRFVLRVYAPGGPSTEMITSELLWLAAIRRETGLGVPEPVPTLKGALVDAIGVEGVPEARRCVLFRRVEGRFVDAGLAPIHLWRVGEFMARLHRHAEGFRPPSGFVRPHQDWTRLFRGETAFAADDSPFTPEHRAVFDAAAEKIVTGLGALVAGPDNYGLIHADLQQTNYLFHRDEARAIDFEDCAWGYFAFDMAIPLFEIADRPRSEAMRGGFIYGYASVRPPPNDYERQIELFTAVRLMKRVNYLLKVDNPALRAQARRWVDYSVNWLHGFLER